MIRNLFQCWRMPPEEEVEQSGEQTESDEDGCWIPWSVEDVLDVEDGLGEDREAGGDQLGHSTPEKEMDVKAVASSFKENSESELASKVSSLSLTKAALVDEDNKENPDDGEEVKPPVENIEDLKPTDNLPPQLEDFVSKLKEDILTEAASTCEIIHHLNDLKMNAALMIFKVDAALEKVDQLENEVAEMKIELNNRQEELISVGEIFTAAGAAFTKVGELTKMLHSVGEPSPSSGKWTMQQIEMLKTAVKSFNSEMERINDCNKSTAPIKTFVSFDDTTDLNAVILHSTPTSDEKK